MKMRYSAAALALSAVMLLGSCAEDNSDSDVINALISKAASSASAENSAVISSLEELRAEKSSSVAEAYDTTVPADTTEASAGDPVDIDLTVMNSTMIYSVIYDIMVNPTAYYGKSLIVDGYFDSMYLDEFQSRYYFVVVPDATACCVQGLEFRLPDEGTYPDDYPDPGTDIRIRGVLGNYEEAGQVYSYIMADRMTVLQKDDTAQ